MVFDIIQIILLIMGLDFFSFLLVKKKISKKKTLIIPFLCLISIIEIYSLLVYNISRNYIIFYKIPFVVFLCVAFILSLKFLRDNKIPINHYFKSIEKKKLITYFVAGIFLLQFTYFGWDVEYYNPMSLSSIQQNIILSHDRFISTTLKYQHFKDFFYLWNSLLFDFLGATKRAILDSNMLYVIILLDGVKFIVDYFIKKHNKKIYLLFFIFGIILFLKNGLLFQVHGTTILKYNMIPLITLSIFFKNKDKNFFRILIISSFAFSNSMLFLTPVIIMMMYLSNKDYKFFIENSYLYVFLSTFSMFIDTKLILITFTVLLLVVKFIISRMENFLIFFSANVRIFLLVAIAVLGILIVKNDVNAIQEYSFLLDEAYPFEWVILFFVAYNSKKEDQNAMYFNILTIVILLILQIVVGLRDVLITVTTGRIILLLPASVITLKFLYDQKKYYKLITVVFLIIFIFQAKENFMDVNLRKVQGQDLINTYTDVDYGQKTLIIPVTEDVRISAKYNPYFISNTDITIYSEDMPEEIKENIEQNIDQYRVIYIYNKDEYSQIGLDECLVTWSDDYLVVDKDKC